MHQSLLVLYRSLTEFFCLYLTKRRRIGGQSTSDIQSERINMLYWENPGKSELETASYISKQMKRALEEESRSGREISTSELLMNVYRHLWTYLVLSSRYKGAHRHFHDQETESEIKGDCEVVVDFLQQQAALLNQNSFYGEGNRSNQALTRILRYLKQLTGRGTRSPQISYDEEKQLKELDSQTPGITCAL